MAFQVVRTWTSLTPFFQDFHDILMIELVPVPRPES